MARNAPGGSHPVPLQTAVISAAQTLQTKLLEFDMTCFSEWLGEDEREMSSVDLEEADYLKKVQCKQ
jgi:hypothetical protein